MPEAGRARSPGSARSRLGGGVAWITLFGRRPLRLGTSRWGGRPSTARCLASGQNEIHCGPGVTETPGRPGLTRQHPKGIGVSGELAIRAATSRTARPCPCRADSRSARLWPPGPKANLLKQIESLIGKDDLVVVTGGGFIGGHLLADLRRKGYRKLRSVDLKPFDQWCQRYPDVDNLQLNLNDRDACTRAVKGAGYIYNFAADMGGMGFIETHKAECMLSVLINTHMLLAAKHYTPRSGASLRGPRHGCRDDPQLTGGPGILAP